MVFASMVRFGWSIGRSLVTYRVLFQKGLASSPLNIVVGYNDKVKNVENFLGRRQRSRQYKKYERKVGQ
jgi:hypothetical protein